MRPTLLLLHGALGSQKQFDPFVSHLGDHFDIHTLNFAGHGGLPIPDQFSMDLFTENVIGFLDKNKIKQTHIFGYSMGGYVALNVAHQFPARVGKILTLGTKFDWNPESTAKEISMLNADKIELKVPHFAKKLHEEHAPQDWKTIVEKTAELMVGLSKGKGLSLSDVKSISHEVIIGLGETDRMVTQEESSHIVSQLKKGRLKLIAGQPHEISKFPVLDFVKFVKESITLLV